MRTAYQRLSHGVPCVATSMAVEGMGLAEGDGVLVADSRQAMADAIVRLHEDAGRIHLTAADRRPSTAQASHRDGFQRERATCVA